MGPKKPASTVLSKDDEALIVAFRKHTLLPLDDCFYTLQESIPHLTRSSLHRCFQRHGISRLPDLKNESQPKKKFKEYPIGFFHIDITELRTEQGKLHLFVAIDRTSKFVMAKLYERATTESAKEFLETLVEAVPYHIHTILTDNCIQFADLPKNRNGMTARFRGHPFDRVCFANGIEHRLTEPNHPCTNGQVERMNRTIKEATVNRYYYQNREELQTHLNSFIAAYNFAKPDEDENSGMNPPEDEKDDTGDEDGTVTKAPETAKSDGKPQQVTSDEQGRLPHGETSKIDSGTTGVGGLDRDDDYGGGGYDKATSDIERILENIAEDGVFNELERQRKSELNDLAQSISYGNAHEGIHVTVHRMLEVSDEMIEQYQIVAGPLIHIAKLLRRQIEKQLNDRRKGLKQTGLLMGRRLNGSSLYRSDGRIFYKNNLPNEKPELAVGLLLDESGSMAGCDRATYARTTAIILYDFCRSLGIPIMVYGHSTRTGVDLYSYAEFDAIDRNDQYRMMDIQARGSNRDGAALRYVMEQVSKRPEEAKIVMLVSDGQPADTGYSGSAAEEDLRGIVQEYRRKGVHMIAAAIGEDRETIERIYGNAYLNISDLNALPVALAAKIKLYLQVG